MMCRGKEKRENEKKPPPQKGKENSERVEEGNYYVHFLLGYYSSNLRKDCAVKGPSFPPYRGEGKEPKKGRGASFLMVFDVDHNP